MCSCSVSSITALSDFHASHPRHLGTLSANLLGVLEIGLYKGVPPIGGC